jgi:hypothetical protein
MIIKQKTLGLVIPTLGERPKYLLEALQSIKANQQIHVCLVAPKNVIASGISDRSEIDQITVDMGLGLAAAINKGIASLPSHLKYVSWLGDDDSLVLNSHNDVVKYFEPGVVAIYGDCNFVDENSDVFWNFRTSQLALKILSWGPNRIPQPGSFYLRTALEEIGYLDESLSWAFDQDMFLRLRRIGRVRYVKMTFANFRWHPDSLSSGGRLNSLLEASKVRRNHAPKGLFLLVLLREWLHVKLALAVSPSIDKKKDR